MAVVGSHRPKAANAWYGPSIQNIGHGAPGTSLHVSLDRESPYEDVITRKGEDNREKELVLIGK